jgi:hypothetical protein
VGTWQRFTMGSPHVVLAAPAVFVCDRDAKLGARFARVHDYRRAA